MIFASLDQLKKGIDGILDITRNGVTIRDEATFRRSLIDDLIYTAVFASDGETKEAAC